MRLHILTGNLRTKALLFAIFLLLLAGGWIMMWLWVPRKLFPDCYSTLLYSAENKLLGARIAPDGQWRFPPSEKLPEKFTTCLIAFEDKRFYRHPGVDLAALARSLRLNLKAERVVSGGSTLTMQLARIARGNRPRSIGQKLIETSWAIFLETAYKKEEILGLYIAHAPFGGNVVGMETAAWRYFGRQADELSWAESATLAVLPNSPALIHPGRNRTQLKQKRDRLLKRLLMRGILNETDYELACLEPLPEVPLPLPNEAPHLLDRLMADHPGERIGSSLHYTLQRQTQALVDQYINKYQANHLHNGAALIADVETGEVLAYAGNASFKAEEERGNRVDIITSPRSTGSILKPFLYAAMLSEGLLLPSTLIPDTPLNLQGFMPQNFNRTYQGVVPANIAIERSLNVPLVRMLADYNTGRFMSLLKSLGMTTLRFSEEHYGASLILGGAEGTLWDLAGMYASLSRTLAHYPLYDGRYDPEDIHPLTPYPSIRKDSIQSINNPRLTDHTPLSHASIWFAYEAMAALNRPEEEADWQQFSSMKRIAWKTGTSYGGRDAWAIGTTRRYVVGVWIGNASGEGRAGVTGVSHAAPLLFDLFSLLPDSPWFDKPYDEMEQAAICRRSGHLATELCEPVDTLYIPRSGLLQTRRCPYHRLVHLSEDGQYRVNSSCIPVDRIVSKSWFILSPAQAYYYRNHHLDYCPLPPVKPGCEPEGSGLIDIIYPEAGAVLFLPKGFTGREQFIFKAAHARPDAILYWHLDAGYLGETGDGKHQIACSPEPGKHTLTLVDEQGNQRKVSFEVK